jgi:hypothetical protein
MPQQMRPMILWLGGSRRWRARVFALAFKPRVEAPPLPLRDEARTLEAVNKALRHDLGHELVGVVDALAALKTQCEG